MGKLTEVEAALALGELRRERAAAGLPGLTELQAALYLRNLAEVRRLPEVAQNPGIPMPRKRTRSGWRRAERLVVRNAR